MDWTQSSCRARDAHELGHLVLPHGHSDTALMRANGMQRSAERRKGERIHSEQTELIREAAGWQDSDKPVLLRSQRSQPRVNRAVHGSPVIVAGTPGPSGSASMRG